MQATHAKLNNSNVNYENIVTARQRSFGKVMFSQLCVCLPTGGESHVRITHDALDLTVQGVALALPPPPEMTPGTSQPWPLD